MAYRFIDWPDRKHFIDSVDPAPDRSSYNLHKPVSVRSIQPQPRAQHKISQRSRADTKAIQQDICAGSVCARIHRAPIALSQPSATIREPAIWLADCGALEHARLLFGNPQTCVRRLAIHRSTGRKKRWRKPAETRISARPTPSARCSKDHDQRSLSPVGSALSSASLGSHRLTTWRRASAG